MAILLVILTLFVILLTSWYVQLYRLRKFLDKFPGPSTIPVIGNAHDFTSLAVFLPKLMEHFETYGKTVKLMLGFRPRLFTADPKLIEFLLGSTKIIDKGYEYKFFESWLGTGLLTSTRTKWKSRRKLITPTFHYQILEKFIEVFNTQSTILVEKLRLQADKSAFDIFPYITMCTLDVICEAAMGTSVNAQHNWDSDYVHSVKELCRILMERSLSPIKMWDLFYSFTNDYQIEKRSLSILHGYTNSVIKKRRQELESNTNQAISSDSTGVKKRLAFLDLLLQCTVDGEGLSDESIREEVDTFMFEGHDTTASGISFILYSLAQNQDVQRKVVEELEDIFSDDKHRQPTYQDLQDMRYLEMVIKESMRLFPPVPGFSRCLSEDVEYDRGILPKGLQISIIAFGLHRQEELFPEPEKFDPERFAPENVTGRSPFTYVPFSAGPRNCIGQKFAILEMKSIVVKVLKHFELLPEPGHKDFPCASVVLKSETGLLVRLKDRQF